MRRNIKLVWRELTAALAERGAEGQTQIAKEAGVSQSAVSRILGSCPNRYGSAFKRLCKYAGIQLEELPSRAGRRQLPAPLADAVRRAWDGSPRHAEALAKALLAISEVARVGRR
jgi:hypothetical protein